MDQGQNQRTSSGRSRRKAELQGILAHRDLKALDDWLRSTRNPLTILSSHLFTSDELLAWRTIEAIGIAARHQANGDIEPIRKLIRHNFWMMNDESGNVGWWAPETIGEVLHNVPELIEDYAPRLPLYFEEEPFERGAFWAVARVAEIRPDAFGEDTVSELAAFFKDEDPVIRYRSLLALSRIESRATADIPLGAKDDLGESIEYDFESGKLVTCRIADLAGKLS